MTRADDLRRLYEYHYWATHRLLEAVGRLTPDEFTRRVAGSYGSVRSTLVHVLSAEWGWLDRCGGQARGEKLQADDYPTIELLAATWTRVERWVRDFLAPLRDEDLARAVEFALGGATHVMPLGDLMAHAALHAVHHRGQLSLLLRELGQEPPYMDFVVWAGGEAVVRR